MKPYTQTQFGFILVVIMLPVMLFLTYSYIFQTGTNPLPLIPFILIMGILLIVNLLFYRLRVIVLEDKIFISFGIGLIWKLIEIKSIEQIEAVKNPIYYGWGIRLIPNGTLYNIAGRKAIELHFKNSGRVIRIGSKDPQRLKDEIEQRIIKKNSKKRR